MNPTATSDNDADLDLQAFIGQQSSPVWRTTLLTITLILAALFGWMAFSEVEEVVRAQGQVEPAGRVKVINHPQGGRVAEIAVGEGQRVSAGDTLLKLDPAIQESDAKEIKTRYLASVFEVERLRAEIEGKALDLPAALAIERPDLAAAQEQMIDANRKAYASKQQTLNDVLKTKQGEMRSNEAESRKLERSLELLSEQVEAVRDLTERGFYPRLKLVELERELNDTRGNLQQARAARSAATAALAEAKSRLVEYESEHQSTLLADLEDAKTARDSLRHELTSQETRVDNLLVTAPADGIVQELAIAAVGQSVAAHEKLMKLVPIGEGLVIRAEVENDDIGKLRPDMRASVKVHAYEFMRHGKLEGRVQAIAADSRPTPDGEDLVYEVKVVTKKDYLGAEPGEFAVLPGMLVDVELMIGERTILSYLTDRIIRIKDETFREG